jgi:membrane protein
MATVPSPPCPDPNRVEALDRPEVVAKHLRKVFNWKIISSLLSQTFAAWNNDNAPRLGAALAYYTALSIAPLLIVVIAVAGFFFGTKAAQGQIVWQIQDFVGQAAAEAVQQMLASTRQSTTGGIAATLVGLLTLFFGASSVIGELRDALNTIWCVAPPQGNSGLSAIVTMLKQRFLSFAMVLGIGFLLLVSLVVNAMIAATGKYFHEWLPLNEPALEVLYFVLSMLVTWFLFALIYKVVPDVDIAWSDVVIGAAATSLLFSIGKFLIGMYLGRGTFSSTYGAAASLVIILVWVYYSAQVFFLGAEFTKIYANRYGSHLTARNKSVK